MAVYVSTEYFGEKLIEQSPKRTIDEELELTGLSDKVHCPLRLAKRVETSSSTACVFFCAYGRFASF